MTEQTQSQVLVCQTPGIPNKHTTPWSCSQTAADPPRFNSALLPQGKHHPSLFLEKYYSRFTEILFYSSVSVGLLCFSLLNPVHFSIIFRILLILTWEKEKSEIQRNNPAEDATNNTKWESGLDQDTDTEQSNNKM